jgi:TonB family protein
MNTGDAGRADMWIAIAQEQEGFAAQADSEFQGALRKADPNTALAATIREVYAQFLVRQGRPNEAQPLREQSTAIRKALGAQAMATTNAAPNVYKIGGNVTAPILLSKIEPEYSQDARAAKYQGTVLLYVEIGTDGLAHNIQVSRGLGFGLDEKAVQAVTQWKFKPATKDGQPVTVSANIEVNFRLL